MFREAIEKLKIIFIPAKENGYRPKFLEGRILFYFLLILLILKLFSIPFFIYFPKTNFFAAIVESMLIKFVNQERESLGIQPLKENLKLKKSAFLKAQDMLEKGYFSHQSPTGKSPWYFFEIAGYNYQLAGENLAIGFLDSEEVHHSWLESPSHRANLLNPNYQEIGVAVVKGIFQGNETIIVVQHFGRPAISPKKMAEKVPEEKVEEKTFGGIAPEEKEEEKAPEKKMVREIKEIREISALQAPPIKEPKEKLAFNFLSFFSSAYHQLLQKIIYLFLTLIILSLLINIFVRFDIQHPDLILKTIAFIFLLILFVYMDKVTLIKIIPHNFRIY